jgi:hypothetical protein
MRGYAIVILMYCATMLGVVAQSATAKPGTVQIRLRLLAFQPSMASEEMYVHDAQAPSGATGTRLPMRTYLNHESATVTLSSRKLILTRSADGGSVKEGTLAETTLPVGCTSAVMVALPAAAGAKHSCLLLTVDDSVKAFPPGTFHVINLSRSAVRIELEKKPWLIPAAKTVQIIDPPVRHGMQCGMKAYVNEGGQWRRFATGLWPHPGKERVIQLLYENPQSKHVQIIAFDDIAPRG